MNKELCIEVGKWNNSILWCTVEKTSNYIMQNKQNRFTNIRHKNKIVQEQRSNLVQQNMQSKADNTNLCQHKQSALNQCTVHPFTESGDTRCCVNTICPPEDGQVSSRNMSRILCGNKTPTRCNRWFLLQILLLAQHVSGTTMPSSGAREYYTSGCCLSYLVLWFSSGRYGVELRVMCPVCGLLQQPANQTHLEVRKWGSRYLAPEQ